MIQLFSESAQLKKIWVLLTVFMPAIMAMGGNSGIQTSTVTVRGLATGDLMAGQLLAALARELRVALGLGVLLGLLVLAVAYGGAVLPGEGSEAVGGGGPTASSNPCRDAPARCWGTWGPWRRWGSPSPRAWCRP